MHVLIVEPQLARVVTDAEGTREWRARLEGAVPDATFEYLAGRGDAADRIAEADIVAGPVTQEAFRKATGRLKWIHSWAAGPDSQLFDELVRSDVVLTCSKGNGAIPLAEHAIMLMLMLQRQAVACLDAQRARRWGMVPHGELNGLTCGIIGVGHSGSDLALKAKAFHMRVLGLRREAGSRPNFDRIYRRPDLHEFLRQCDFVVVTAPRTPATIGMLGDAEFRVMKPSAYYICFSRGGIADDAALLSALREGCIAGAGLDAHGEEPLPPDSPFWDAPNTLITPHCGATTVATHQRGLDIFIENLRRYASGESLVNVVDKHGGY